ncbi:hypothetical protein WI44_00395 [Burkholderia cepacia]|uniref:hypothetical protein n=1 Tax=Burkholderia cepacia TaxID=292 RepID=UPI000754EEB4|nr:hypothetical protein [Burkholderia cepacia]KVA34433.1 hypothetical protein WI44_00395 [Burkholderia cepacia]KVA42796.1 hypothetical protein WI45_16360 [Burkholderia cepacia]MCA8320654.1 hypothetical protein [Burkholderia cepacia]
MKRGLFFVLLVGTVSVLSGCDIFGGVRGDAGGATVGSATAVRCQPLIKYSGYQVEVSGVNIPVGGKTINIGKVFVAPEKIREAQAATQALDVLQFNQCQTMLLLPANERLAYATRREQTIGALSQALQALNNASNAAEYNKAVSDAQKQNAKLSSGAAAAGATGASAPAAAAEAAK